MKAEFDDFLIRAPSGLGLKVVRLGIGAGPAGRAGVFFDQNFGVDKRAAKAVKEALRKAGFGVALLSARQISDPAILNIENLDLLVLPRCCDLPGGFAESLPMFLRQGGDLIVFGGPMFMRMLWEHEGRWLGLDECRKAVRNVKAENIFLNFEQEGPERWRRSTDNPGWPAKISFDSPGVRERALHVRIPELTGWDTFGVRFERTPFLKGHILTCFWAKGTRETTQMVVEWAERDGSRWIATLELSPEWRYYALLPEDFEYWPDNPSVGRGGPGDRFRPENACYLSFGLALSHCRRLSNVKGLHEFWVDEVRTAPHPFGEGPFLPRLPILEMFPPSYKVYPLREVVKVELSRAQRFLSIPSDLPSFEGVSPVPRMRGLGLDKRYIRRWIKVFGAFDREGRDRGASCSVLVNLSVSYFGSVWAGFSSDDPRFVKDPRTLKALSELAKRMAEGVFLAEGGSEHFAYWQGERIVLGAKVVNFGRKAAKGEVDISVRPRGWARPAFKKRMGLLVPPAERRAVKCAWEPKKFEADQYIVSIALVGRGREVDRIEHEFQVIPDWSEVSSYEFVKVRGGEFWLRGREWHPVGGNYWPRYMVGWEPFEFWAHWLTPGWYDPEMVEEELSKVASLRMTMVSVNLGRANQIRNLHDFLIRCQRHGIKVNLFVGCLDPLLGDGSQGVELIKEARLSENPIVFAYDIAWEPNLRGYDSRKYGGWKRFNSEWREWIVEQYGSLEEAEREWGYKARRLEGEVVGPLAERLQTDGPWRRMVAAYRRFIYDIIGERYCKVARRIREADPNHLISFRGCSSFGIEWRGFWPMNSPSVARCMDFLSPEGYHLLQVDSPTPQDEMLRGGLITLYYHFISRGKPVFWAELGGPIYPNGTPWEQWMFDTPKERIEYQKKQIQNFLEMFLLSGAQGWAIWWFPGGYRVDERSDWGIFNPDGTERPVCQVMKELIPRFWRRAKGRSEFLITLDPFVHPKKEWEKCSHLYFEEFKAGKAPKIRTEGTGKSSLDVPLVCADGTPYRGKGPL